MNEVKIDERTTIYEWATIHATMHTASMLEVRDALAPFKTASPEAVAQKAADTATERRAIGAAVKRY
jgi:hypothetical protein